MNLALLRPLFPPLRQFCPIVVFGKGAFISRYLDVVEVLGRDVEFTISQINGPKLEQIDGPFLLGLDRGPEYDRQADLVHQVMPGGDLPRIADIVKAEATRQIQAAWPKRRIDVVNGYARIVALRFASRYFGVPFDDEQLAAGWLRDIFRAVFLNPANDRTVMKRGIESGIALGACLDKAIAIRKAAPCPGSTDVLGRLVSFQRSEPWLADATIRRNLSGLIVGTVDNTAMFLALSLTQLLKRPRRFALAREAALAGDRETVRRYIYEAGRFYPTIPFQLRYANVSATIAAGTRRARTIQAGTTLLLGNVMAMFDPDGFDAPETFDIDHDSGQLHFGFGLHRCAGAQINSIQVPELASGLLSLSNLRRAGGKAGTMEFEGPFPNRLLLDFD